MQLFHLRASAEHAAFIIIMLHFMMLKLCTVKRWTKTLPVCELMQSYLSGILRSDKDSQTEESIAFLIFACSKTMYPWTSVVPLYVCISLIQKTWNNILYMASPGI